VPDVRESRAVRTSGTDGPGALLFASAIPAPRSDGGGGGWPLLDATAADALPLAVAEDGFAGTLVALGRSLPTALPAPRKACVLSSLLGSRLSDSFAECGGPGGPGSLGPPALGGAGAGSDVDGGPTELTDGTNCRSVPDGCRDTPEGWRDSTVCIWHHRHRGTSYCLGHRSRRSSDRGCAGPGSAARSGVGGGGCGACCAGGGEC
jgi:hypothetical protein